MGTLILQLAFALVASAPAHSQGKNPTDDWVKTSVCGITFLLPSDMKNLNSKGVDSCVADFSNGSMSVMVDLGFYGGAHKKSKTDLELKEESILIGGKTGTVAIYIDDSPFALQFPERRFVVYGHVLVRPANTSSPLPMDTTLDFVIFGKTPDSQTTGKRILRSVVFN